MAEAHIPRPISNTAISGMGSAARELSAQSNLTNYRLRAKVFAFLVRWTTGRNREASAVGNWIHSLTLIQCLDLYRAGV